MDKQKGLAAILIVLLIALAVGGYLIYQKQTQSTPQPSSTTSSVLTNVDETANWKTYTDYENGFSFRYPDVWDNKQLTISVQTNQTFDDLKKQLNLSTPEILIDKKRALKYATGVYILL